MAQVREDADLGLQILRHTRTRDRRFGQHFERHEKVRFGFAREIDARELARIELFADIKVAEAVFRF